MSTSQAQILEFNPQSIRRTHPAASVVGPALPLQALDALNQCLAVVDWKGRVQHATTAFLTEIGSAPDGAQLLGQLTEFAETVCALAGTTQLADRQSTRQRAFLAARGEYQATATRIRADSFANGAYVLIALSAPGPDPFDPVRLKQRFRLTAKQALVARLLSEGLRNHEIARRLFISTHTVRHHIEQIRVRTGGHTRAAIVHRIRRGG